MRCLGSAPYTWITKRSTYCRSVKLFIDPTVMVQAQSQEKFALPAYPETVTVFPHRITLYSAHRPTNRVVPSESYPRFMDSSACPSDSHGERKYWPARSHERLYIVHESIFRQMYNQRKHAFNHSMAQDTRFGGYVCTSDGYTMGFPRGRMNSRARPNLICADGTLPNTSITPCQRNPGNLSLLIDTENTSKSNDQHGHNVRDRIPYWKCQRPWTRVLLEPL
jgi:hypothetical protein